MKKFNFNEAQRLNSIFELINSQVQYCKDNIVSKDFLNIINDFNNFKNVVQQQINLDLNKGLSENPRKIKQYKDEKKNLHLNDLKDY